MNVGDTEKVLLRIYDRVMPQPAGDSDLAARQSPLRTVVIDPAELTVSPELKRRILAGETSGFEDLAERPGETPKLGALLLEGQMLLCTLLPKPKEVNSEVRVPSEMVALLEVTQPVRCLQENVPIVRRHVRGLVASVLDGLAAPEDPDGVKEPRIPTQEEVIQSLTLRIAHAYHPVSLTPGTPSWNKAEQETQAIKGLVEAHVRGGPTALRRLASTVLGAVKTEMKKAPFLVPSIVKEVAHRQFGGPELLNGLSEQLGLRKGVMAQLVVTLYDDTVEALARGIEGEKQNAELLDRLERLQHVLPFEAVLERGGPLLAQEAWRLRGLETIAELNSNYDNRVERTFAAVAPMVGKVIDAKELAAAANQAYVNAHEDPLASRSSPFLEAIVPHMDPDQLDLNALQDARRTGCLKVLSELRGTYGTFAGHEERIAFVEAELGSARPPIETDELSGALKRFYQELLSFNDLKGARRLRADYPTYLGAEVLPDEPAAEPKRRPHYIGIWEHVEQHGLDRLEQLEELKDAVRMGLDSFTRERFEKLVVRAYTRCRFVPERLVKDEHAQLPYPETKPALYAGVDLGPAFANIGADPTAQEMLPELPALAAILLRRIPVEGNWSMLDRAIGALEKDVQSRRDQPTEYKNTLVPKELLTLREDLVTLCFAQLRRWLAGHRENAGANTDAWLRGVSALQFDGSEQRLLTGPTLTDTPQPRGIAGR